MQRPKSDTTRGLNDKGIPQTMIDEAGSTQRNWASIISLSIVAFAVLIFLVIVVAYATGFASGIAAGQDIYGNWPAVILSVLLFALFLVAFLKPWQHRSWREMGVAQAYLVALFTEMFGLPLTIYLLPSVFGAKIGFSGEEGHLWATLLASTGLLSLSRGVAVVMIASSFLISLGVILIVLAWRELYPASGLVTTGVYAYVRHPQYVGFFLIVAGFLVQWPTIITAVMAPVLSYAYFRLAVKEEKDLLMRFGEAYKTYAASVSRFVPRRPSRAVK